MNNYADFIQTKTQLSGDYGFSPIWMPDFLYDFQQHLVEWCIRKGRSSLFADCGLGKTPMQLVWADNIVRKTNGLVLVMTPLAVSYQTIKEAEKFGIEATRSRDGRIDISSGIIVTNYEQLGKFDPDDFAGAVCDESACIKSFDAQRTSDVTEFMRRLKYRLLCTATPSPNDFFELGTSSEALGELGYRDMLGKFFKQETKKDHLGWGRVKYRFRGHSEQPFWRWVCSWARACRKPSDLGFDDGDFILPPLNEVEIRVECNKARPGELFALPATNMDEQRAERRLTLNERCERAAEEIITHDGASLSWCHLNPEADLMEKLIPDALQVSGSMSDEQKEERLLAFSSGELSTLVTKPKIGCWGMNWQHCHHQVMFPSDSFEQYYQGVRRSWRFGQKNPVTIKIITTEGGRGVLKNLQRKSDQANTMFESLSRFMNDELLIGRTEYIGSQNERIPQWL